MVVNIRDPEQVRRNGIQNEYVVLRYLEQKLGVEIRDPSVYEDVREDIDAWIVTKDGRHISASVKVNEPRYYNAPFVFEKAIGWYKKDGSGDVVESPSWFYKGKAQAYLVWKRRTVVSGLLWYIDAKQLKAYVKKYGFDSDVETGGVSKVREIAEGKAYTKLGLMRQDTLIDRGIAKRVGVITYEQARRYRDEWWQATNGGKN